MTILAWVAIPLAYLLGAIPSAVWYGKFFFKKDIRSLGSGNAGATNTMRAFGKKAAVTVLTADVLKGVLAVLSEQILRSTGWFEATAPTFELKLLLGLVAALGHIYPIFAKFKGGKGVATLLGVLLAIDYVVALMCLGVFVLVFIWSRWVSLSSIIAGIAFVVIYLIARHPYPFVDNLMVVLYPILLIFTHRSNIARLVKGEEPKMRFSKKAI